MLVKLATNVPQVYLVAILKDKIMITEKSYLEAKKLIADYESEQLNKHIVSRSKTEEAVAYGDYVMMNDRLETVHIWTKELEELNASRWKPYKITKEEYDKEMQRSWNK